MYHSFLIHSRGFMSPEICISVCTTFQFYFSSTSPFSFIEIAIQNLEFLGHSSFHLRFQDMSVHARVCVCAHTNTHAHNGILLSLKKE